MIQITSPEKCCGCTACASICPHDAISMEPDALGFLYPKVDLEECVGCGLCDKVCSFNESYDKSLNLTEPLAFAARHKNAAEVSTSRSGAAFIAISDYVLQNGGIVYGAGYTDHFRVVHKRAATNIKRDEFKGSKYVQSDLGTVFRNVKKDLLNGLIVLFSGTPCQTSGLNSYVGKKLRDNLILVDIVCHGVPGPYVWRDYLAYLERRYVSDIHEVDFRNKELFGWTSHRETYTFSNGLKTVQNAYTYLFYRHIMFRHSCGVCHFTNLKRPSDITIGDFWGWQKVDKQINADDKGLSLVILNTQKGIDVFDAVKDSVITVPAKLKDCLQPNLVHPSLLNKNRVNFERDFQKKGILYVMRKYGNMGARYKVKSFVKALVRRFKLQ